MTGQLWSLSTTTLQVRIRIQLNSILFAKTLKRKDVASSSTSTSSDTENGTGTVANGANGANGVAAATNGTSEGEGESKKEDDFSSKAQIMTLMTTDVDRVSEFSWHLFTLIGKHNIPSLL